MATKLTSIITILMLLFMSTSALAAPLFPAGLTLDPDCSPGDTGVTSAIPGATAGTGECTTDISGGSSDTDWTEDANGVWNNTDLIGVGTDTPGAVLDIQSLAAPGVIPSSIDSSFTSGGGSTPASNITVTGVFTGGTTQTLRGVITDDSGVDDVMELFVDGFSLGNIPLSGAFPSVPLSGLGIPGPTANFATIDGYTNGDTWDFTFNPAGIGGDPVLQARSFTGDSLLALSDFGEFSLGENNLDFSHTLDVDGDMNLFFESPTTTQEFEFEVSDTALFGTTPGFSLLGRDNTIGVEGGFVVNDRAVGVSAADSAIGSSTISVRDARVNTYTEPIGGGRNEVAVDPSSAYLRVQNSSNINNYLWLQDGSFTVDLLESSSLDFIGTGELSVSGLGVGATGLSLDLTESGLNIHNLTGAATTLSVDGSGNIIRTPSDQTLKTDISQIENALDKVNQLNPVSYDWLDQERFGNNRRIGFLAQEVQEVIPEVVAGGGDYLSLNYGDLTALNAKAIQELDLKFSEIEALAGFDDGDESTFTAFIERVVGGIKEWVVETLTASKVQTDEICVGQICVTENQFEQVFSDANNTSTETIEIEEFELSQDEEEQNEDLEIEQDPPISQPQDPETTPETQETTEEVEPTNETEEEPQETTIEEEEQDTTPEGETTPESE